MAKKLAHISEDHSREQTVYEHLTGTAELAKQFAAAFGAEEDGYLLGLLHDIGKYSDAFQHRLDGGVRVDHSTAGAKEACAHGVGYLALAIAGHHGGIPNFGSRADTKNDATLSGRLKRDLEPYDDWKTEVTLPPVKPFNMREFNTGFRLSFYIRMLFSCLVDADFIDTETFMDGKAAPRGMGEPLSALLEKVRAQAKRYLDSPAASPVAQERNKVLRACMEQGTHAPQGLYTLTVPTGGGKTFASLAFALEHAVAQKPQMERIIYVIPYTSIIDQTAQTFADLLGEDNVLAHFSGVDYKLTEKDDLTPAQYRKLLSSENWDAPIVVTTAVQFFESLYANRSSRCRKLHNIANSVILFDEAQTFPTDYLKPCVSAIAQLVQHYHTTAVLCTATQPALTPLLQELAPGLTAKELSPDPAHLYEVLRRVTRQDLGILSAEALCAQLSSAEQVLCVVNRRKTAQDLFAQLPAEGSYCLTTFLCAADRRRQLDEIRQRLKAGLPCRVVSTSLIEAGVDVDFPLAYREAAGLDSLLQTAGRCNREGRRDPKKSIVASFQLEGLAPLPMLSQNVNAMNATERAYDLLDTPDAIHSYFESFYRTRATLDKQNILDAFQHGIKGCQFPFAQVAGKFHLIDNHTYTIYLPIEEGADLCALLRGGHISRAQLRRLGIYSVECYEKQFRSLDAAGALERSPDFPDDSAILADPDLYSRKTGLSMEIEEGRAIIL